MDDPIFDLILNILGNKTRRLMLELLSERPRFLSDISKELQIGQQAILRHIEEFQKAGIIELTEELQEERKIGRKPKYYKIAENRRIIIDITPDTFDIDLMPSFLEIDEPSEQLDIRYCSDLGEIEKEVDTLEKIKDPDARYEKIKRLEEQLQNEIKSLLDAKHYAESLLERLSPKKDIVKKFLGISQ